MGLHILLCGTAKTCGHSEAIEIVQHNNLDYHFCQSASPAHPISFPPLMLRALALQVVVLADLGPFPDGGYSTL